MFVVAFELDLNTHPAKAPVRTGPRRRILGEARWTSSHTYYAKSRKATHTILLGTRAQKIVHMYNDDHLPFSMIEYRRLKHTASKAQGFEGPRHFSCPDLWGIPCSIHRLQ
jgi:hypothetical protein